MESPLSPSPSPSPSSSLPPASQPQRSNRNPIIIIVVAVVAGLCLIACAVGALTFRSLGRQVAQGVNVEPQAVTGKASDIATFDLPEGFTPQSSMNLLGFTFVVYEAPSRNSILVLVQMPIQEEMTEANIRQMQEQMEQQTGRSIQDLETIDSYDTTIRGKPGKVIIQEGTGDNGQTIRQMLVVFQGKGGLAMLSIFGPANAWKQAEFDRLVESIR